MKFWHILLLMTAIFIFSSCEKERTFQLVEQEFSVSKDTIIISAPEFRTGFFAKVNSGFLNYTIKGLPIWLYSNNSQGQLTSAGTFIELSINTSEVITSPRSAVLTLETPIGIENIVVVYIPERVSKAFVEEKITILNNGNSKILDIFNPETVGISWMATIDNNYISLSKTIGQMDIGGADIITITVNKDMLPASSNNVSKITFIASGKTYQTEVNIISQEFGVLDRNVVDAVFAKHTNEIVFISNAPKSITKLNPITNQSTSIEFNLVPLCLAISEDNKTAVVGCNAKIIVVDLENMETKKVLLLDSKVTSISIAPNNFAYTLTDGNGFNYLTEINLTTGSFRKNQQFIYSGSIGKLHPNGRWLYLADNFVSPSDVRKFSLAESGISTYLYDSPYHGDYIIGGNLWFNSTGDRILTGSVFLTTSENKDEDLKYAGSLDLPKIEFYTSRIWSASYSNSNNKWYLSLAGNYSDIKFLDKIYVYDSESFELDKTIDINSFLDENGNVTATEPRFIFNDDSNIYALVKEKIRDKWALQTIKK